MTVPTVDHQITYTVIQQDDKEQATVADLKKDLENPKDSVKIDTMKRILLLMLNGDSLPQILMHVIRFVMPSKNKTLKKLLMIYWELVGKRDPPAPGSGGEGKMKQEMVLVCNALRNDLLHPNEFIRGNACRFLCKLTESELLEPLIPSIRTCLEHKHPYVRKNAVLAIAKIYKLFEYLIPDAPELIGDLLLRETDQGAKRNAFIMLEGIKPAFAAEFLCNNVAQVGVFDDQLQIAFIQFVRKDCGSPTADKGKYISIIFELLNSQNHAVKYEAATALVALTSHTSAVKAAASTFIELANKESDNNIKLIVLDRISELQAKHSKILSGLVLDFLKVLTSPDLQVREKCLQIILDLTTSSNVEQVLQLLQKELVKSRNDSFERINDYRIALIKSIHSCSTKFSDLQSTAVDGVIDFISDPHQPFAYEVIQFVKHVLESNVNMRAEIVTKLQQAFSTVESVRVYRPLCWILGEYSLSLAEIEGSFKMIWASIGDIPIVSAETKDSADVTTVPKDSFSTKTVVLSDGTYATESVYTAATVTKQNVPASLRTILLGGEFFIGATLAAALAKLVMRYATLSSDISRINTLKAEAMLIMTSIIRLGQTTSSEAGKSNPPMEGDELSRILLSLKSLADLGHSSEWSNLFLNEVGPVTTAAPQVTSSKQEIQSQPDELVSFRFLQGGGAKGAAASMNAAASAVEADLNLATGLKVAPKLESKLSKIVQLTGYSDAVYAEAYVNIHQFDINLDIMIVNQTAETLQNMTVEFSTLGDLKVVERPAAHTMAPHSFHSIRITIKVSSTENGMIFGNIVYDGKASSPSDVNCVILNEIPLNVLDYLKPGNITDSSFRLMWGEFEWENKVNVSNKPGSLMEFLNYLMAQTNMRCVSSEAMDGDCSFLAANLYTRSIFGEDALANVSIQTSPAGIVGTVRIRARSQGMAMSMGELLNKACL